MRAFRRLNGWCAELPAQARTCQGAVLPTAAVALAVAIALPSRAAAQQGAAAPLVFDGVSVVDVEQGRIVRDQRVVIVGARIQTVGGQKKVKLPSGARVVPARGKYLIPGLWDIHSHSDSLTDAVYLLYLANGVTGLREPGSAVPLATLRQWRQEILAGTRIGPPRQILSGPSINWGEIPCQNPHGICLPAVSNTGPLTAGDSAALARTRQVVDSLRDAGADMLKPRDIGPRTFYAIAAEARRLGIPFGGHSEAVPMADASDSGIRIVDHIVGFRFPGLARLFCGVEHPTAEQCRPLAEHLRRNGTWLSVDVLLEESARSGILLTEVGRRMQQFWADSLPSGKWLHWPADVAVPADSAQAAPAMPPFMPILQASGMPLLVGTDFGGREGIKGGTPGYMLQMTIAASVLLGLTPLNALQAATLNPARMLHGTDSLGTVAAGKLADLVLLDGDPLADITNVTAIRAVVANGRYFDRAALDALLAQAKAIVRAAESQPSPTP